MRNVSQLIYGRLEFLELEPELAIPLLLVLSLAAVVGTFGNILILVAVATRKNLHNVESIFIVNLACSDMYVTVVDVPMGIVAKLEGVQFFNQVPGLCRTTGSICTISCVSSLLTIAAMSCNRYVYIVHNHHYSRIFTPVNCCVLCGSFYCVGLGLVLLNLVDIGDHRFDHKSLDCIWARMATFEYTVVLSVVMVWVPIVVTGAAYLHIYLHVRAVNRRVHTTAGKTVGLPGWKLARTLFIIYVVVSLCWIPYAILVVADKNNTFSREIHVIIVVWAHLHPSINWLVFYFTHRKFKTAFKEMMRGNCCRHHQSLQQKSQSTPMSWRKSKRQEVF